MRAVLRCSRTALPNGSTLPDFPFLVVAPAGRDAQVICQLLQSASIDCESDEGERLFQALTDGSAAGAVVTDEAMARLDMARLRAAIDGQPRWSDFPFVLLSRRGETRQGARSI